MFGIGGFEFFLILIFGFLIFGPDKLPDIAKTIGKAIAKFRGAQEDMTEQLKNVTFVDKESDAPIKNPLDVLEGVVSGKKDTDQKMIAETKASDDVDVKKAESFAERKARYDREREERKRAETDAQGKSKADGEAKGAPKHSVEDASDQPIASSSKQISETAPNKTICKDAKVKEGKADEGKAEAKAGGKDNEPAEPIASVSQKAAFEEVD